MKRRRPLDPYDDPFSDVWFCCSMPAERALAAANLRWLGLPAWPMEACR